MPTDIKHLSPTKPIVTESIWTLESLYVHFRIEIESLHNHINSEILAAEKLRNQRFESIKDQISAVERSLSLALTAADKAVSKAEAAAEKRFESVNEFRQSLTDQSVLLIPRKEAEQRIDSLSERTNKLERFQSELNASKLQSKESSANISLIIGFIISLVVAGASIVAALLK